MSVFEVENTIQKWDDDYYTPVSERLYDRAIRDMLSVMKPPPNAEVVDAGCGPGVHSIRVANAGFKVHAIDISSAMLREARARVARAGLTDSVRFDRMDLTTLPLPDASVDYAFSWGVLIHIPDPVPAFEELARVLRPGGRLALYITNSSALDHKLERMLRFILRKPLATKHLPLGEAACYEMNGEQLWVWQFDSAAVVSTLEKLGFRLMYRRSGEFSEIQRRCSGLIRNVLLSANNFAYAIKAPAGLAVANLLVFERLGE